MLKFTSFGGEVPRLTKRQLPDSAAQEAVNLLADTSEFRPLPEDAGAVDIGLIGAGQTCKTLYRYPSTSINPVGTDLILKLTKSPIIGDTEDRVYMSAMKDNPSEMPPMVMTGTGNRILGVIYPTAKPTLSLITGASLLTQTAVENGKKSLLDQVRSIVREALMPYAWNPAFDASPLTAARGFRVAEGDHIWQRVFGVYAASAQADITPGTWVTFNGSALDRHMWITLVQRPPFTQYTTLPWMTGSGSTNRAYFVNFHAKAVLWKVKADVTAQVTALEALEIPGTTSKLFTSLEVSQLFSVLRTWLPDDPLDIPSADAQVLLTRFQEKYSELVPWLENGFDSTVTPELAFQQLAGVETELRGIAQSLSDAFDAFAGAQFNESLAAYLNETRFDGKFPEGETELVEPRFYTYTFVNSSGEESKPYLPGDGNSDTEFEIIEVNQQQGVTVIRPAVDSGVIATHNLSKWRIYRAANGSQTSAMLYVGELPIGTTTFSDTLKTEQLNEPLVSAEWFPPPVAGPNSEGVQGFQQAGGAFNRYLKGIINVPGGFMAGFLDNTVYFSEVFHPYAWPPAYSIPVEDDIRALGVFGNTVVVLTNGRVSFISGSAPDAMQKIDIETVESCASARSVVPVSGGVIFASHNGLCLASQQGVQNLTAQLFTRDEWLAIDPYSLICEEMDGVVYFTQDNGVKFMGALHVPSGKLVRVDTHVTAMYSDYRNGRLYVAYPPASGGVVPKAYALLSHATNKRTARWKSKRIVLEKQTGFAWLAVEGEQTPSVPLNVNIWGFLEDGTQVKLMTATGTDTYSAVVTDTQPIRVESGRFKDFEVEISGQCRVSSVLFASSTAELQGVN